MSENTPHDVPQGSSPAVSENVQTQAPVAVATEVHTETATPAPGSQTPEANLYAALQEERQKRKELEQQLLEANTSVLPDTDEVYSDEGKVLKTEIDSLRSTITKLEDERNLERLVGQFPALKDFRGEFDSFRQEYPRHKLENVAKLFLSEKGLLGGESRIGLETTTGGDKQPQKSGLTVDEIADMRKNDSRKYQQYLMEGKIQVK